MMKYYGYRATLVAASMCGLTLSQANATGYVLLEGGISVADLSTQGFDQAAESWQATPTATDARVSDDDKNALWRLGVGYALNDHWAVEVFYEDLGEYSGGMTLEGTNAQNAAAQLSATESIELSGIGAQVVGQWHLNSQFSLLGSAGVSYLENERHYRADVTNFNTSTETGRVGDDSHEWVPTIGFGASFQLTEQLDVRGRYTRYFDAGETANLPNFDLDTVSAGLTWRW